MRIYGMQKYPCILADPVDSKSDWEIGITLVHFATAVNEKKKEKKKKRISLNVGGLCFPDSISIWHVAHSRVVGGSPASLPSMVVTTLPVVLLREAQEHLEVGFPRASRVSSEATFRPLLSVKSTSLSNLLGSCVHVVGLQPQILQTHTQITHNPYKP